MSSASVGARVARFVWAWLPPCAGHRAVPSGCSRRCATDPSNFRGLFPNFFSGPSLNLRESKGKNGPEMFRDGQGRDPCYRNVRRLCSETSFLSVCVCVCAQITVIADEIPMCRTAKSGQSSTNCVPTLVNCWPTMASIRPRMDNIPCTSANCRRSNLATSGQDGSTTGRKRPLLVKLRKFGPTWGVIHRIW